MKYLLYYNSDSKFVTDQTNAGGDGTNVVSVVDGVAWTKDREKTYYRYSNEDEDITTYTITINYKNYYNGETIAQSDTVVVSGYTGKATTYMATAKAIDEYVPVDGGKSLTITGAMSCDIYYIFSDKERITDNTILVKYLKSNNNDASQLVLCATSWVNQMSFVMVDGERVDKNLFTGGTYAFTGASGSEHTILYVFNQNVTGIPVSCFENCRAIKKVKLSDSVTTIGTYAFKKTVMDEIEFGKNVTTIGNSAFTQTSLRSVTLPDSVTSLGDGCFHQSSLRTFKLSSNLVSIGKYCFSECYYVGATEIVIPKTVTSIGERAFAYFYDNGNLGKNTLIIEDGVGFTTIPAGCFDRSSLKSAVLADTITTLGYDCFLENKLEDIILPRNLTTIGGGVFQGNNLTSIILGEDVTSLGDEVFSSGLTTIICKAKTAPQITNTTFRYVGTGGTLYCPEGSDYSQWLSSSHYYLGSKGWSSDTVENYFYNIPLTAKILEDGNITFGGGPYANPDGSSKMYLYCSVNNGPLQTLISQKSVTSTPLEVKKGDVVQFFATNSNYRDTNFNTTIYRSPIRIDAFCYLYGNILSIVNRELYNKKDRFNNINMSGGLFGELFGYSKIVDASNLLLPETLNGSNDWVYTCSLYRMFSRNTYLKRGPTIKLDKLGERTCYSMFVDCNNLKEINFFTPDISGQECLVGWVSNVSETGVFTKLNSVNLPSGGSGIPNGWTVVNV